MPYTNVPTSRDDNGSFGEFLCVVTKRRFKKAPASFPRQVLKPKHAAMRSAFAPNHLFEIKICSNDYPLVAASPLEYPFVGHAPVTIRYANDVMALVSQPSRHGPARVNIQQEFHV